MKNIWMKIIKKKGTTMLPNLTIYISFYLYNHTLACFKENYRTHIEWSIAIQW